MLTVLAPAKINLVLEVLGKRDDGYHEIRSIMQTVDFCDSLTFTLHTEIIMECNEPALRTSGNLVLRAAELLRERAGYKEGARIILSKSIPVSAGLGGGSSDAASTLIALNTVWKLGLTVDDLASIASELGSDVPFFIYSGLALIKGRGEIVIPLPATCPMWFVLLFPPLPPLPDKTKQLYNALTPAHFSNGENTGKLMEHWSICGQMDTIHMYNVFDSVAVSAFPRIEDYIKHLRESGAEHVHLAGSGPTLIAPAASCEHARQMEKDLRAKDMTARAVPTLAV